MKSMDTFFLKGSVCQFPLTCSSVYLSGLSWCSSLSSENISCRDVCVALGLWHSQHQVTLEKTHTAIFSLQKSWTAYSQFITRDMDSVLFILYLYCRFIFLSVRNSQFKSDGEEVKTLLVFIWSYMFHWISSLVKIVFIVFFLDRVSNKLANNVIVR